MLLTSRLVKSGATRQKSRGESIPAPVLGWNARDPLDGMKEGFAVTLDNWFPQAGYCELRKGYSAHATGLGGAVESVMEYSSGTTAILVGAANGKLFDCSDAGAVGTALASGFTSNQWQHVNFRSRLFMVNGVNQPQSFNGTTVSNAGFSATSLTETDLIGVHVFKSRLFFIEKNSASFWYGGVNAITGALSEFDLSGVHPQGGNLMAIGTMTLDGGTGVDDLCAFFMQNGAVLVYSGTDPSDANAWSLVGKFAIGPPIGRRCLMNMGADLIVITADGYIPLLPFLRGGRQKRSLAVSDNISGAVNQSVQDYSDNFGWQAILYPKGTRAIFNVPTVGSSQAQQHVMNTITGAWCRFTGINAICWATLGDDLYFGASDGKVYKADTGYNDAAGTISTDGQTAHSYIGGRGVLKRFTMMRPKLASDGNLSVEIGIGTEFQAAQVGAASPITGTLGATWDVDSWDSADWGGSLVSSAGWKAVAAQGYSASVRLKTTTKDQQIRWYSTDLTFETGGFI